MEIGLVKEFDIAAGCFSNGVHCESGAVEAWWVAGRAFVVAATPDIGHAELFAGCGKDFSAEFIGGFCASASAE